MMFQTASDYNFGGIMKKALLILVVLLMAVAIIGCSKKETAPAPVDPNAPVKLLVWCWDPMFNVYAMNEAVKIYQRDHPNVSADVMDITEIEQKVITALSSGETDDMPDILLNQDNSIQRFVQTYPDAYLPLNGKVDLSKFAQFKLDVGTYEGKNYGVPFDNGATATFLRRDIVEQAGYKVEDFNDITWETFIEQGQVVREKTGVAMLSTTTGGSDILMLMTQSAGKWFFDDQGNPYVKENPVIKRALEIYKEMVDKGVLLQVADWNAYIASLNNGQTASTIQGCWIIGSIVPATDQAGKWAVVNTPKFGTIDSVNYSSQGGSGWMVLSNSKYPDVAMDLLDKVWAGSVEFYETILPSSGAISTWLPAADSTVYGEPHPFFGGQKIYEDLVSYASKVPKVKYGVYNYEARDAVGRALVSVLQGASVDSALATAQKDVESIINQ
jgi:lactose/L-arabinose transport system substrate-binding protein